MQLQKRNEKGRKRRKKNQHLLVVAVIEPKQLVLLVFQ